MDYGTIVVSADQDEELLCQMRRDLGVCEVPGCGQPQQKEKGVGTWKTCRAHTSRFAYEFFTALEQGMSSSDAIDYAVKKIHETGSPKF
jgi:hypothetical protein